MSSIYQPLLKFAFLALSLFLIKPLTYGQYCIPVTTLGCTDGDVIARVTLNTLDNNSGTGCPSGTLGYSDYTGDPTLTTDLLPSTTYGCTVYAGQYQEGYAAWIDYNDDGIFDISERIGYSNGLVAGSGQVGVLGSSATFPVALACNPPVGTHRLRVRAMYNVNGIDVTPCGANTYGETEDYLITILPPPACPAPGLVTSIAVATTNDAADITFNFGCSSASAYDFEYGVAGFTLGTGTFIPNRILGVDIANLGTAGMYPLSGLQPNQNYEIYYRANCGAGQSAWSIANAFQTDCNPISLVNPGDQTLCGGTYTLPAIAEITPSNNASMLIDYFDEPNGSGNVLSGTITSTTTVYAYAAAGSCFDEEIFTVTIGNNVLPSTATTLADVTTTCDAVNLSISSPDPLSGYTYEWEVSPDGAAWSTIPGQNGVTAAVTQSTASHYRVKIIACDNSFIYGDVVIVGQNLATDCYCVPQYTTLGCTDGDVIARVTLNTLDNNSGAGCPSGTIRLF
jgi:hypothetical protein